ncbi:unnamed protein product [Penicillium olsonii]|uniref:Uncharacterized protein n=1 Tax=Penicillium olsonii TaxID=99116 RepID=A0A9W4MLJ0_PENOL|nr:unnamed protein product [Penicillium olsonii]
MLLPRPFARAFAGCRLLEVIARGMKIFSSRNSANGFSVLTSTRCVRTVYIILQYRYRDRTGAATVRFRTFRVMDFALFGHSARGPKPVAQQVFNHHAFTVHRT